MERKLLVLLFLVALLTQLAPLTFAQFNCEIQGTIRDASQSAIPDASIRVRNLATNITRATTASAAGVYRVFSLPPGTYEVSAQKSGFQLVRRESVMLGFGDTAKVDFVLELATVKQEVTVSEQSSLVNTEDSEVSSRMNGNEVRELPLNGRNVLNLVALQPGIIGRGLSTAIGSAYGSGNDSFSGETEPSLFASGMRSEANTFTVDDTSVNSESRLGVTNLVPNSESVDQVRVITNNFSAAEGQSSGARIEILTKAGTNKFHGGVSYYFQNNTLASRNIFEKDLPVFRKNQFSYRLGGPIWKNRTFFYHSYEGLRQSGARGVIATVETQAFRDFVVQTRPNSIAAKILTELPPDVYPTYNFRDLGSPAPGVNKIGPHDGVFDVGSAAFLPDVRRDGDQWSLRIDHELRPGKDRLYGNYYRTGESTLNGGIRSSLDRSLYKRTQFGSLNHTHIFGPTLLNEFRAGITRLVGLQQEPARLDIPAISISGTTGFTWNGNKAYPAGYWQTHETVKDVFSWNRSTHSLKVGGELRHSMLPTVNTRNFIPSYTFGNLLDFADDEALRVQRSVDPRTGDPTTVYANSILKEWALFINDDWKVRRNFTLTIGLRYENFGHANVPNYARNFVLGPGADMAERIASGKVDIVPQLYDTDNNNFAPRIGFAWDVGGKGKMSIRGGYGISYDRMGTLMVGPYSTDPPLVATATLGLLLGSPNFIYSLGDPTKSYLGYPVEPQLRLGLDARNGIKGARVAIGAIDPGIRSPYVENWSFSLQRTVARGTIVEANYLGSAGHHLYNQASINRYTGDLLLDGKFTGLNPSFSSITTYQSDANSAYHGGTIQVRHSFAKGFSLHGAFTFGKAIDETSGFRTSVWQDVNDRRSERGLSAYDVPRKLTIIGLWQMPFFRRGLPSRLLGGWQLSGFAILEAGQPIDITNNASWPNGDFNGDGLNQDRPNAPSSTINTSWGRSDYLRGILQASNFPKPVPGTDGNLGRNVYRGPGFAQVDLSVAKRFTLAEGLSLQLRMDAFNAFNRVNLNNPVTDLNSSNFGRSTGTSIPRAFQAGLRVAF